MKVQKCDMNGADSEKYIGDVISFNVSNDSNIASRKSVGKGALLQIYRVSPTSASIAQWGTQE